MHRLAVVLTCLIGASAASEGLEPDRSAYAYRIYRDGSPVGRHVTRILRDGPKVVVETSIDAEVRLAFIRFYKYRHRNREEWLDDRLVRFVSETDDNGEPYSVDGHATPAGFKVRTRDNTRIVASDVRPASFWNKKVLRAVSLIHTKTGATLDVSVRPGTVERVKTPLGEMEAQHYVLSGDLAMDLWFVSAGPLAKLRMLAGVDDSTIEYRPVDPDDPISPSTERRAKNIFDDDWDVQD